MGIFASKMSIENVGILVGKLWYLTNLELDSKNDFLDFLVKSQQTKKPFNYSEKDKKWLHFLVKSQETNKHSISSKVSQKK